MPQAVAASAVALVGPVTSVTRLDGGLSGAAVLHLAGARAGVVAKGPAHPRECAFYEHVRIAGVATPRLLDSCEGWLLLEHLPAPLPRSRWVADAQVAASLRSLHHSPRSAIGSVPDPFRPSWDDALHAAGTEALALSGGGRRTLDHLRGLAAPLFDDRVVISGDANPGNWRVDDRSRPVLLDWDRIGLGHPAVDLGISLPGLPSRSEAESLVAAYGGGIDPTDVLLAKLWSLVEFAAETGADPSRSERLEALRPDLEAWLGGLARA